MAQLQPVSSSTVYSATVGTVPPPISFTPASPSLSLTSDGVDVACPLGFAFNFYNVSYTAVNVGANGNIQFQTGSINSVPSTFGSGDSSFAPFIASLSVKSEVNSAPAAGRRKVNCEFSLNA